jgi:hypothetical protein
MSSKSNIDTVLEKLTQVSLDLKSMLSVHEHRITAQEKTTEHMNFYLEKRREETDHKLKDVYDTMRSQDNNILEEITKLRTESNEAHKQLSEKLNEKISSVESGLSAKIGRLERFIYLAIGGGIVATYLVSQAANYYKIFH